MPRATPVQTLLSLLALLLSGGVAAFGLTQLAASLMVAPFDSAPLPPPTRVAAAPADAQAGAVSFQPWPALFGHPAPPPAPTPAPIIDENPFPDDEPYFEGVTYTLRGLVYQGDGLGYAMLETEDGIIVVRQGDILPGGETVLEVAEDGIEIGIDDDILFVGFEDTGDATTDTYETEFGDDPAMIQELQGNGDQPYGFGLNPYGLGTVGRQSQ